MEGSRRSMYRLYVVGLAATLGAACANPLNPASPSTGSGPEGASAFSSSTGTAGLGGPKTRLCHVTGNGSAVPITVSQAAVDAHLAHGDWVADESDPECAGRPEPAPRPLTLTCGAPAGASHPGGPTYPGPNTATLGGIETEFLVVADPAPPAGTLVRRQIFHDGAAWSDISVPLANGRYQDSIYTSGAAPFVRELRFTLDDAQCSLYWNFNAVPGA